mmetsp:Transcript_12436/g.16321  ORF Transcript_12436/g.16321 Transcript_12436/m.16321 type:complete len:790 (-) Transcript_12436:450-2819(-)
MEMETQFLNACKEGKLDRVKELIKLGVNVHTSDNSEFTGIHWAAKKNHVEVLKYLVKETDLDVNQLQITGMGAIHMAAFNGATKIVKYLVEEGGADVNHRKGGTGSTPSFLCSQTGNLGTLEFLIQAGADVNIATVKGATPLSVAAEYAELECVKCLVEKGKANLEFKNVDGFTPLMKCCGVFGAKPSIDRKIQTALYLIKSGANVHAKEKNLRSVTHLAARSAYMPTLKSLVDHGADVNDRDSGGFVPLCDAATNAKRDSIEFLLSKGADPAAKGWNGNTFFHLAAANTANDDGSLIDFILKKTQRSALPVDIKNFYGYTPLHLAAQAGNIKVVTALLKAKASLQEKTNQGDSPLHLAIERGHREIVGALLKQGADPAQRNFQGHSCISVAKTVGMEDLFSKYPDLSGNEPMMTTAEFFVSEAKNTISENIDLDHVLLLPKSVVLQAGCMPHYDECQRNGWHTNARAVRMGQKVLFVSHRWGAVDHPDPTGEQYELLALYLRTKVKDIDFIWLDYACICQDKTSELFGAHLSNIPTSVICSSHMLIIPKLEPVPHTSNPENSTSASHLADYLDRAWCLFESMAGLLTTTTIHLSFQLGDQRNFRAFGEPQSASSSLGFFRSKVGEWNKWLNERPRAWCQVNTAELSQILSFIEPCRILAVLMNIALEKDGLYKDIAEMTNSMAITKEEIFSPKYPSLKELWDLLGHCFAEDDKVIVLNLTLFMGFYTMRQHNTLVPDAVAMPAKEAGGNTIQKVEVLNDDVASGKQAGPEASSTVAVTDGNKGCCSIM